MAEDQSGGGAQAATLKNYEEFVYPSGVYYFTHPDRIAIAGLLAGASPPPVENCRILELGCSDGGNLNSMASTLPGSQGVGIDLAPKQIEMAERTRQEAGLENAEFHAMSFTDIGDDFGQFDYIVAHGLFSWIPRELQPDLLATCERLLSPNGIAYLSFNVYPGARDVMWLREKLLYHVRDIEGTRERATAAWQFAHFIAKVQEVQSAPHHGYMQELLETFNKMLDPEAYFFHEYLEADNNPLLLSEFFAKADAARLHYLGDACPKNRTLDGVDPGLAKVIRGFSDDPREQEQYLDLALDTGFRRAILCRKDAPVGEPARDAIPTGWFATCDASLAEPDPEWKQCFVRRNGRKHCSDDVPTIDALTKISSAWPGACPLTEVAEAFGESPGDTLGPEASGVLNALYRDEFIRLHTRRAPVATEIPELPEVSSLVRGSAERENQIPTLYHANVAMDDPVAKVLLAKMDGTRDRDALAEEILTAARDGVLGINVADVPLQDSPDAEKISRLMVDEKLDKTLDLGLFLAPESPS